MRARAAYRLGFRSVEEWLASTTSEEQARILAVAWLDGWGEEWTELAASIHNSALLVATSNGAKFQDDQWRSQRDCERTLKDDATARAATETNWNAFGAAMQSMILGRPH